MTVAITDYASLSTAINDFTERTYDSGELDRLIGLAESIVRLYLGPNYARNASATLTVTSGAATVPTGFIRPLALTHATYGKLDQTTIEAVRQRRIWDASGIPDEYAITGSTVEVAPSFTGSLSFDYEGTLTGLSSGNTTNWLVTTAPHAYLMACLAVEKVYREDMANFAAMQMATFKTLDDLGLQAIIGQNGRSRVILPGVTP